MFAIKITKSGEIYTKAGDRESRFLNSLQRRQKQGEERASVLFQTASFRGHFFLVLELVEGGDLSAALKRETDLSGGRGFSLNRVQHISHELLRALVLLQGQNIIHADLKPQNILCADEGRRLILADFGLSVITSSPLNATVQTRWYRAPEVILSADYGLPIDMWSLGCMLAELYTGIPLFPGRDESEQLEYQMKVLGEIPEAVRRRALNNTPFLLATWALKRKKHNVGSKKRLEEVLGSDADPDFVDFILRCLGLDPDVRMTPEEALRHPFMKKDVCQQDVFLVWMQDFMQ